MTVENDIQTILDKQSAAIRELTLSLRKVVMAVQPDLEQGASVKLSNITFKHNGVVCALTVHKAHVNLHFYKGVQLNDPEGLLQGGGKALRHLRYETPADIDEAVLARFVREAYRLNE